MADIYAVKLDYGTHHFAGKWQVIASYL